jgi:6-phosphofructokinase 1
MSIATLGILVGGGPAPGINGVIGAAAIESINNGMRVIGFYDGFRHLIAENFDPAKHTKSLHISEMGRIHFDGGSILRISRANLVNESLAQNTGQYEADEIKIKRTLERFDQLGITHLLTIGGDGTAGGAKLVARAAANRLRVVHVPKTIDNDLPLPDDVPTFGYYTAKHIGTGIVANLMEDSRTTNRWYIIVTMGRNAGYLALGIGKSAGVTLSLIPEEFPDKIRLSQLADIIEGSILKRRSMGREDGVAVLAEGLVDKLADIDELAEAMGRDVPRDSSGRVRLSEIPLAQLLHLEILKRFRQRGDALSIVGKTFGYELRCAPPTTSDMAYTRDLAHGAVRLLIDENNPNERGQMVSLQKGHLVPIQFEDMEDPDTGKTKVRTVDLNSYYYHVARAYMIRLERRDFESDQLLADLAAQARMTPEEFRNRYSSVVERDPHAQSGYACKITFPRRN